MGCTRGVPRRLREEFAFVWACFINILESSQNSLLNENLSKITHPSLFRFLGAKKRKITSKTERERKRNFS
jgi:hypothetical protein